MPAQNLPGADHTYVESSTGSCYGCFGRSTGGNALCSAGGNVDQADCLSGPNGTAGILYGLTGVCHQAANRILLPAKVNILKARGARGSVFTWGMYGRGSWTELTTCQSGHNHP